MDMLTNLAMGFATALSPINMLYVTIGVVAGTLVGALPGIGPVAGLAILIPLSFGMEPTTAMILMAGIYYGSMYGGTITSVLMNVPGESSTIMTCLDGHAMARKGRAGPALTISAVGSFVAGTFSVVMLMLLAPPIADAALRFGPPEYFALMLLGLTAISGLTGNSKVKGYVTALIGLAIAMIGLDVMTGGQRYTLRQHGAAGWYRLPAYRRRSVWGGRGTGDHRAQGGVSSDQDQAEGHGDHQSGLEG